MIISNLNTQNKYLTFVISNNDKIEEILNKLGKNIEIKTINDVETLKNFKFKNDEVMIIIDYDIDIDFNKYSIYLNTILYKVLLCRKNSSIQSQIFDISFKKILSYNSEEDLINKLVIAVHDFFYFLNIKNYGLLYQNLVEQLPAIIYITDLDGKILYVNPQVYNVLGFTQEEWLNDPNLLSKQIHPEDNQNISNQLYECDLNSSRHSSSIQYRVFKKDGSIAYLQDETTVIMDENGEPLFIQGILIDITRQKLVEEENRKLSKAVEQSPISIVITDTNGDIEYVNKKFCDITGYSKEEVIGKNPRILKSNQNSPELYKHLWKTITSGKSWTNEFINRKKDGTNYWENVYISPIFNEKGVITNYLGLKEDITQKKEMENNLKELLNELNLVNKKMKHELEIARNLQSEILPKIKTDHLNINVLAYYKPLEELGGDFYDIYANNNTISFVIVDATGHGVSAGLLTFMAKILFADELKKNISPSEVLNNVNIKLCNSLGKSGYFLTATYGIIDLNKMKLYYANAGHPPMLLQRNDNIFLLPESKKNYLLGVFSDIKYTTHEKDLKKGDKIIVYTDGLIETHRNEDDFYGIERLSEKLLEYKNCSIKEILDNINEDLNKYRNNYPIEDDITIILFEIL